MIEDKHIIGAIIAGGNATRMGGDNKALKQLGETPLIQHIATRLSEQVDTFIINANRDQDVLSKIAPCVADEQALGAGPLAGILQSLLYSIANHTAATHLLTVASDTPFFPENLVEALCAAHKSEHIIIARSGGFPQPVFGLWPIALADDLHQWLLAQKPNKVMAWVRSHPHVFVDFEIGAIDPFFNINTAENLAEAESLLAKERA